MIPLSLELIDMLRGGLLLVIFGIASIKDIRTRIIKHTYWTIPILLGVTLTTAQSLITLETYAQTEYIQYITYAELSLIAVTLLIILQKLLLKDLLNYNAISLTFNRVTILILAHISTYVASYHVVGDTLYLITFSSIGIALAVGSFLHFFPKIGMGGADLMAILTIGFFLPTHISIGPLPHYTTPTLPFPELLITLPVINIITNTGILFLFILPMLLIINGLQGNTSSFVRSALTIDVPLEKIHLKHGQIIRTWGTPSGNPIKKFSYYFTPIDTFFLQDYVQWRQEITNDSTRTLADDTKFYGEQFLKTQSKILNEDEEEWNTDDLEEEQEIMQHLLSKETVCLMPGIPFLVPLTFGMITLFSIGDLLLLVLLQLL